MSLGYALLSVQSALLGEVTPELRAVVVDLDKEDDLLFLRFYYDGEVSEKQIDLWQCAMTESDAGTRMMDGNVERLDYPQEIPFRGRYAYRRKEPILPDVTKDSEAIVQVQRELVDFQEIIGLFVSPVLDARLETQWGIIHYVKDGCHIVPAKSQAYTIDILPLAYAMLSMQRALLGVVIKELITVIVDVSREWVYIRFYYEGDVPCDVLEDWECAMTETWADLGSEYVLDGRIERMTYPTPIPFRGRHAYRRKEVSRDIHWPIQEEVFFTRHQVQTQMDQKNKDIRSIRGRSKALNWYRDIADSLPNRLFAFRQWINRCRK